MPEPTFAGTGISLIETDFTALSVTIVFFVNRRTIQRLLS